MGRQDRNTTIWASVAIAVVVLILLCVVIQFVVAPIVAGIMFWDAVSTPMPCVDGQAGSPAIFRNADLKLFTFPKSASNIDSSCLTWQGASISVWFDADPEDVDPFLESMRWDVGPLTPVYESTPWFSSTRPDATYLYAEYSDRLEGAQVWVDTSSTPYRVYLYIYLD